MRLSITDTYIKYVEDAKGLIQKNTKLMTNVYLSDLNPQK